MKKHELHTETEINATPRQVWAILTDFASYPAWNPFITSILGIPERGETLRVRLQLGDGMPMTLRPVVVAASAPHEFGWRGRFLLPGIFDGEHRFVVEETPQGSVVFRHSETFSGILLPFFRGSLFEKTRRAFGEMNLALKTRAETLYARSTTPMSAHRDEIADNAAQVRDVARV